ncbi:hypothetical protein KC357_g8848 [Hortaea werneckii]|nr:hypothetical protein KC357_g8848 [Hortaea werneckii]
MTSEASSELSSAPASSRLDVPTILQRESQFDSTENHASEPSTGEPTGYEGLQWGRLRGWRPPVDDRKLRSWIYKQGHGWRLYYKRDRAHYWLSEEASSGAINHLAKVHKVNEDGPIKQIFGPMDKHVGFGYDDRSAVQNSNWTEFKIEDFEARLYSWILSSSNRQSSRVYCYIYNHAAESIYQAIKHNIALLGLVAHFISAEGKPTTILLALPRQTGRHTGIHISSTVSSIIQYYGIQHQLGNVITDNASNNEVCLRTLGEQSGRDYREFWVRCTGHIFNLVAQSMLFDSDTEAFEEELSDTKLEEAKLLQWRRKGPIGKLHNIIYWIARSGYLTERLNDIQLQTIAPTRPEGKLPVYNLIKDVVTRWNSFDDSAERALYLRPAIDELCFDERVSCQRRKRPFDMEDDVLDEDDWHVISVYHQLLHPIKEAVGYLQGEPGTRHGSIWQVLPVFETVLEHLERARSQYPVSKATDSAVPKQGSQSQLSFDTSSQAAEAVERQSTDFISFQSHLSTNINLAWQKLNHYYERLDDSSIYVAAVVLHPRMKWRWIEKRWAERKEWIQPAKEAFWRRTFRYSDQQSTSRKDSNSNHGAVVQYSPRKRKRATRAAEYYNDVLSDDEDSVDTTSFKTFDQQLAEYNAQPRVQHPQIVDSPINWWLQQRQRWPQLSAMALDIYATPAMSDAPERLFSEAGAAIDPRRQRLHSETVQRMMCCKSWLKSGLLKLDRTFFEPAGSLYSNTSRTSTTSEAAGVDSGGAIDLEAV